ncbi:MAG: beta-lactamase family protein [Cyanobacteria bacterium RYN_339]|nr:beta-lactamase family protein [Cyanobacteria bacterium RYN_339]
MKVNLTSLGFLLALIAPAIAIQSPVKAAEPRPPLAELVADVSKSLMKENDIPGLAVGIITPEGRYAFTFGVASKATQKPMTTATLFEIGSVSKTFTATLAAYAEVKGKFAMTDRVTSLLPELKGSALDDVSLLNLATHTTGGMPLQFPDSVTNGAQMMNYYRTWKPTAKPGSSRTYANPSIGLLGLVTAKAMQGDFTHLMADTLYPAFRLKHTYLDVPQAEQASYAQGYTKQGAPIRMTPGVLDKEAYGVRTTITDLTHYVEANMGRVKLEADWAKAIARTHGGYYRLGAMTQTWVWEQYDYPVALRDLLAGNSAEVAYKPNAVTEISPPGAPRRDVWINKTGSTNGFGAYVAFVPEKELGIVILANKNYPIAARVIAAHRILTTLAGNPRSDDGP